MCQCAIIVSMFNRILDMQMLLKLWQNKLKIQVLINFCIITDITIFCNHCSAVKISQDGFRLIFSRVFCAHIQKIQLLRKSVSFYYYILYFDLFFCNVENKSQQMTFVSCNFQDINFLRRKQLPSLQYTSCKTMQSAHGQWTPFMGSEKLQVF